MVRERLRRHVDDVEAGSPDQALGSRSYRSRCLVESFRFRKSIAHLLGGLPRRRDLQDRNAGDIKGSFSGLQPQVLDACSSDTVQGAHLGRCTGGSVPGTFLAFRLVLRVSVFPFPAVRQGRVLLVRYQGGSSVFSLHIVHRAIRTPGSSCAAGRSSLPATRRFPRGVEGCSRMEPKERRRAGWSSRPLKFQRGRRVAWWLSPASRRHTARSSTGGCTSRPSR
jgi:hypothetical protein